MNIDLKGKSALVTGSARGIGLAIATKLAQSGAAVMLTDVDEQQLVKSTAALHCNGIGGDITDEHFPNHLVEQTIAKFGGIDIIVNNAGYTWDTVIQKTTDEQFLAMLNVHVVAPFRVLRAASNWLRETAKKEAAENRIVMRKVVNITSISGLDGNAGQAGYSSGKAAVVGLTKTLAKEWGRYNVNVNSVGFGLIETRLIAPMGDSTRVDVGGREVQVGMKAEVREAMPKSIPLGRLGSADDAANAVFFFCSPLSDYVTGEVLVCGGGLRF